MYADNPNDPVRSASLNIQVERSAAQAPNYTYPSLIDWTVTCLRSYDEQHEPSYFRSETVFPYLEFVRVFRDYKKKMERKGILNKEIWTVVDRKTAAASQDFMHPYATVLDMDDGNKVCFMGDLHGSLHSLLRNLWRLVSLGYLNDQFKIIKKDFYMVFTGDYVDRGRYGIEVLYTLLRLKCANWGRVHLIRGNHEMIEINKRDGLYEELTQKYGENKAEQCMGLLSIVYDTMPLAVYIVVHKQIIKAVHGGFAPYDYYFDVNRFIETSVKIRNDKAESLVQKRYFYIPLVGEEISAPGYQWCDFEPLFEQALTDAAIFPTSGRVWHIGGASVPELLRKAGLSLMIRGHQHACFGLKVLGAADTSLVNIDQAFVDPNSGQIHWVAALFYVGSEAAFDQHNKHNGFQVSTMIPVLTFSSAVEGVGLNYDCFGILTLDGMFETWRLKVYEFPVSFISKLRIINSLPQPFTLIKPGNMADRLQRFRSTSGMEDSVFIKFLPKERAMAVDESTMREWLQEIVNVSAGNGQSASQNIAE
ncbi:MAG: Serine/threonine-protein phosphatase [candidate division TM6 bacterium GW2011_GWF2_38_10]|nr:MAG: Serine/threonine-protein phosphatase [candidate division TM6 bacterium GW2011_GWF2_38_10]